ncbi:XE-2 [Mamestra configurata nucleopolyhedrovirus A]|uniref:XE-2 n=2 Tax=Mamestra configurata nucleopolyhedrovirus TaxID=207830 RepID=Q8QLF7_NPVMC|nr:hypothetical protein McnAVgp077 [Mamestra configurata nucleopolyhedrovirus A]UVZ34912.1 SprT-like (XE-2) [Melanchra picta nucleopolyhedrovirus]AAM09185.1 unknown [Mamestra configurata nucleopolyhedrovirus A]AAQ11096.1 XE-2 [Mamestra configurata nucleopolyhedrovirus A]QEE79964.1 xe-2 [Mamestra configurata nucleopolyhedrovirus A]QNH90557.1 xe-2 [Mamestra configurata nucleopolyhedrovirus A]
MSPTKTYHILEPDTFMKIRGDLAYDLFDDINKSVFDDKLRDVEIVWSNRLRRVAGRWEKKKNDTPCKIVLSSVLLTDQSRLVDTLAHEMCHVAVYMVDNKASIAHNDNWLYWVRKVIREYENIDIKRQHCYNIDDNACYMCSNCNHMHRLTEDLNFKLCKCSCGGVLLCTNKKD